MAISEKMQEDSFDDFFPMICEDCGKSFGKDVTKLAIHAESHYPNRDTKQPPTRYRHRNKL